MKNMIRQTLANVKAVASHTEKQIIFFATVHHILFEFIKYTVSWGAKIMPFTTNTILPFTYTYTYVDIIVTACCIICNSVFFIDK